MGHGGISSRSAAEVAASTSTPACSCASLLLAALHLELLRSALEPLLRFRFLVLRTKSDASGGPYSEMTYTGNDILNLLLVTLHLENTSDLHDVDLFPEAQAHDLIKGTDELERVFEDLALVCASAHV